MLPFLFAQLPTTDEVRRTAEEVLSRPYYELDTPLRITAPNWLWELFRWMLQPLFWLLELTEGLPQFLRWVIVVVLSLIVIALIAHIGYSLMSAIRGTPHRKRASTKPRQRVIDPAELEREADQAGGRGDHIGAIRLLFRASLLRLQQTEKRKFRPGFTNRDLLRRYRSSPLVDPLRRFVETIDAKWYGEEPCLEGDYVACREGHQQLLALMQERSHAVGT